MEKAVITIIGLGQIGTSIGLALQTHEDRLLRIGHTRQFGDGNHAKTLGAVDKVMINLPDSVRSADVVVLALPMHEVRAMLEFIAQDLKEGAVVLDTSPVPSVAISWAEEFFPQDRYFVGFTPVLNPKNLITAEHGIQAAKADLFKDGLFVITSGMRATSEALKVAADLATMMQAAPLFADTTEVDSYMARVHLLPQLVAASMVKVTQETAGWDESRKIAGRPYAQVTNIVGNADRAHALALSAHLDKEHVLRALDAVIEDLHRMREQLSAGDDAMTKRIEQARAARAKWWSERQEAEWMTERAALDLSQAGNPFGQLFGIRPRPRPKKKDEHEK
jgi:prephenate dehydrogenase